MRSQVHSGVFPTAEERRYLESIITLLHVYQTTMVDTLMQHSPNISKVIHVPSYVGTCMQ